MIKEELNQLVDDDLSVLEPDKEVGQVHKN